MVASVLVTGGLGFIGSHVARALLDRGERVVVLDAGHGSDQTRKVLGHDHANLMVVTGSVTDLPWLLEIAREHNVQRVVHAAAIADAGFLWTEPYRAYEVNIGGTANVLEMARRLGTGRVLYISSIAAFTAKRYEPIDEDHPVFDIHAGHPAGPYGASKAAAEILGMAYYSAAGVDFVALRPAGVYGYGMSVPAAVKQMVEGACRRQPVRQENEGAATRSFTYIKDCVAAILAALDATDARLRRRIYVVADDQAHSLREMAEIIRELIPGADISFGNNRTLYEQSRQAAYGALTVNAAVQDLGLRINYRLRMGLADYIETFRRSEGLAKE